MVKNSLLFIVSLLANIKVGGAYVPLDLAYQQERINSMLQDARITMVITQQMLAKTLEIERMMKDPAHSSRYQILAIPPLQRKTRQTLIVFEGNTYQFTGKDIIR